MIPVLFNVLPKPSLIAAKSVPQSSSHALLTTKAIIYQRLSGILLNWPLNIGGYLKVYN